VPDLLSKEPLTEEQIKSASMEDLTKGLHGLVQLARKDKEDVEKGQKTLRESHEDLEKRLNNIGQAVEKLRQSYPPEPVTTERQAEYAGRKGGLFRKGSQTLQPIEILNMSPNSPMLRGTDSELVKDFQDAWDACVFKAAIEVCKAGGAPNAFEVAVNKTVVGPDYKRVVDCVKYMGYDSEKAIQPRGYTKPEEFAKQTLIHPEAGGIVNPLTFTVVSAQIIDLVRIRLNVADKVVQIPLVHTNQKLPVNRGDAIGVRLGAATTDPPPTANITTSIPNAALFGTISFGTADFDCENVGAFLWWNDRAPMESAVPLVPYLRDMISFAHARAVDRSTMSGDIQGRATGVEHMDDHANNFGVRDARHLWNGFRRIGANYMTSGGGGTLDAVEIKDMIKRMKHFGLSADDLHLWVNTGPLFDLLDDPYVRTVDVFGPQAAIQTGMVAKVWNIPISPTEWIPNDLDATTGFSTAAGTTTAAVLANVKRFGLGQLGIVGIETTRIAPMLTTIIQAVGFMDFVPFEAVDANEIFAASLTVPLDIRRNLAA